MKRVTMNKRDVFAEFGTVKLERYVNAYGRAMYIVQAPGVYDFWDFIPDERKAYKNAAKFYNSLVPDAEAIPLF